MESELYISCVPRKFQQIYNSFFFVFLIFLEFFGIVGSGGLITRIVFESLCTTSSLFHEKDPSYFIQNFAPVYTRFWCKKNCFVIAILVEIATFEFKIALLFMFYSKFLNILNVMSQKLYCAFFFFQFQF
eukprot:TRINITY_DN13623_c0_g1_i7.p3 TRINITY_DN13623_c0_g1~~TRINITY_DN13623_c0_g1_i7.p3  ORF type:complete len:130 (-),score=7.69 TRINITY_DN13623_c0_g1_i7:224-613(-)